MTTTSGDSSSGKGEIFRNLHNQQEGFVIPNPWDVGTSKILASMGYKALATTSAGMSFSMGIPEGTATRAQTLEHCRLIVNATDLPVSADLENGFDDTPDGVAQCVLEAAETGLAGCSIEDHTGRRDDPIYEFSLALERIEAAVAACRSLPYDFVFTARCENFLWGRNDLDDTIKRLSAFETAGADVLYAPGLRDLESIRIVCEALNNPVNVVMGMPGALFGMKELHAAGVRRISVGSALARASFGTFVRAAEEMAGDGTFTFSNDAIGFDRMDAFFS
ncbi:2-methylisocitrate lyase [Chromatiales bacterium (ex Bugula neritina AB1)]|nr:2-methylisocitrate lyase [Chromatiales bacterium (ex Bugula neritina AB1)]